MKTIDISINEEKERLVILSNNELSLIEAMSFYFASFTAEDNQMTKKAADLNERLLNKLEKMNIESMGDFNVWES